MHYVYMFTRIHKHIDIDMVDIDTGAAIDVDSNKDIRIDIHTSYIFYLSYVTFHISFVHRYIGIDIQYMLILYPWPHNG